MNDLIVNGSDHDTDQQSIPVTAVVRLKHGILHELAKRLGSQSAVARELGVSPSDFGRWINLKARPPRWDGQRAVDFSEKILSLTGHTVDEIWPDWLDECLGVQTTNEITREFTADEMRRLESPTEASGLRLEAYDAIENVLKSLTYREREIIKLRYGLGDGHSYTLEETGRIFKVTKDRIRQIQARAIAKLQHHTRAGKLRECAGLPELPQEQSE